MKVDQISMLGGSQRLSEAFLRFRMDYQNYFGRMRRMLRNRDASFNQRELMMQTSPQQAKHGSFFRSSKAKNSHSLGSKILRAKDTLQSNKIQQNPEIYFDRTKRSSYLKNVIDNYFTHQNSQKLDQKSPTSMASTRRKDVFSSEAIKRKRIAIAPSPRVELEKRMAAINTSGLYDSQGLPTISEVNFPRRPISEHRSQRTPVLRQIDMDESVFYQSNRQLEDSKIFSQDFEENKSYKTIISKITQKKNKLRVYNSLDNEQLRRQLIIKKLGYPLLWQPTDKLTTISYPPSKNLRQRICSIIQSHSNNEPLYLIYPKPYYSTLFSNNNEQLIDIITAVGKLIEKGRGEVTNNQITLDNIVRVNEKDFRLSSWECAGIRETLKIRDRNISSICPPICREGYQWLTVPEYLAPQMLRAIEVQTYEHLWAQPGGIAACDIWSLGCVIVQIITLVPIAEFHHCVVKGSTRSRRGLMGLKNKSVEEVISKQKHFRSMALRRLKDHLHTHSLNDKLNPKILDLLPRMLQQDPNKRITSKEILKLFD